MITAPPVSRITNNIYVGSSRSFGEAHKFNVVVNCTAEQLTPTLVGSEVIRAPLTDTKFDYNLNKKELYALYQLAYYIASLISSGKTVLFYCHMGMNRSSLMAALTMLHLGYDPDSAIATLRKRNRCVLSNESFVKAINEASRIGS